MGNRSWLYLESPACGNAAASSDDVAEANNNLPVLWQILLADGAPGPAIATQRVFGDAGTNNLSSDAAAALGRIRQVAAFVARHPLLHTLPQIGIQFEALVQHLESRIAGASRDGAAPRFSADLDELSWRDTNGEQDEFIERCRRACNARWETVRACIASGNHPGLDEALMIGRFADWQDWAWHFGFGGLSHAYFSMQNTPREERYAEFDERAAYAGDTRDYDNHIGDALWRFQAEDGRWGVRVDDGRSLRVVAEPEWDAIWDCGGPERGLQWISRAGRIGLLLAGLRAAEVVLAPQLDEVWDFEEGVATALVGDLIGLLRPDGSWLLAPSVDEVASFFHGYASASLDGQVGFIDASGQWAITPRFDDALDFTPCGLAPARTGAGWGLVRPSGEWATPPSWEAIQWRHDWQAFEASRAGKSGLIDGQGRLAVEPLYAELEHYDGGDGAAGLRLAARDKQGRCGLIDAQGRVLVPFAYGRLSPFEPLSTADAGTVAAPGYVRIANKGKGRGSPWLYGVYDIAAACERIACRHRELHLLAWGDAIGWLVGDPLPRARQAAPQAEMALGLARADGTMLHAQAHAWLAQAMSISEGWFAVLVRADIHKRWSAGQPIQAVRNDSGNFVWLHADGREEAHAAYMAERYAAGDLSAAYDLARHYRNGLGIDADDEAARLWMARAAGVPADGRIDTPQEASAQGLTSAMRELALMLGEGEGGPADPVAERGWLEEAIRRGGGGDDARLHVQLGYALIHGVGGEPDLARGLHHYDKAADAGNAIALLNLGFVYKDGSDAVPADAERALGYLRRADAAGHKRAAYYLGSLLRETASAMKTGAAERYAEAIYFLRKAAEEDEAGDLADWACYELGFMHYKGEGMEEDDDAEAERWLLRGASQERTAADDDGQRVCIEMLAQTLYGHEGSSLHDPARAEEWRRRLA